VQGLLAWLGAVPPAILYLVLFVLAAAENVFPPLPTDTVVAFGTWLAARGDGSAMAAFLATWIGNVAGAAGMYLVGRRHGTGWMRAHFPSLVDERGEQRLRALYARYGILALVVSRFLPGVRALVPPFAGALRVPAGVVLLAMAGTSGVWYGAISYVAFRAGDWDALMRTVARSGRVTAIVAAVLVVAGAAVWMVRRRGRTAA
jgi:membrane protein DedA with SNARE-associated domain